MLTPKQFVRKIFEDIKSNWFLPVTEHQVYSTTETVIGVWTDGKPLYRSVIDCGALPANTEKVVNHGIANIDKLVYANGCTFNESGTMLPLPFVHHSTLNANIYLNATNTQVIIRTATSRTGFNNTYVTIHYTKTTDTASYSKVPFEPLVEYSLEEKMVGFWVDGKPIYRKTVDFGALPNNNTKTVAHGISDFGKIVDLRGVATNNSSNTTLAIPHPGNTLNNMISINITDTNVTIITGSNRSAYYCTVTLYYTKTTE